MYQILDFLSIFENFTVFVKKWSKSQNFDENGKIFKKVEDRWLELDLLKMLNRENTFDEAK